jgi:HSP20 family protein
MAKQDKKEGNGKKGGDGAKVPARVTERPLTPARWPAWGAEHPLSRLREEVDALFDRFFRGWADWPEPGWGPERFWGVDVEDTDREVLVRAEAPGFEPQDFDIQVSGNTLTIRAERKQEAEQEQGGYRISQRRYGRFQRSIPLPAAVDADRVEAHYRNGVLELRLPRTEEARRRRIEVKA